MPSKYMPVARPQSIVELPDNSEETILTKIIYPLERSEGAQYRCDTRYIPINSNTRSWYFVCRKADCRATIRVRCRTKGGRVIAQVYTKGHDPNIDHKSHRHHYETDTPTELPRRPQEPAKKIAISSLVDSCVPSADETSIYDFQTICSTPYQEYITFMNMKQRKWHEFAPN